MLRQYENPYHKQNLYIELRPGDVTAEELRQLITQTDRPLQAMIDSSEEELACLLRSVGFERRRRCYALELPAASYAGETLFGPLNCAGRGEAAYKRCAVQMYQRYCKTHAAINPWTADEETFAAQLPDLVWYDDSGNLAFVEDNEIAYVTGNAAFDRFAARLIPKLFAEYAVLSFEADECDEYAMRLWAMFNDLGEDSVDTYIYRERRTQC